MAVRQFIFLFFSFLFLSGCMVGPNFHSPPPPVASRYTENNLPAKTAATPDLKQGGKSQRFVKGMDIPSDWWQLFHSTELNQLIQQGINHNPTLAAAEATLRQSEETFKAQFGLLLLPSVTGQFSGERQRFSG